jgi:hypothetical protein
VERAQVVVRPTSWHVIPAGRESSDALPSHHLPTLGPQLALNGVRGETIRKLTPAPPLSVHFRRPSRPDHIFIHPSILALSLTLPALSPSSPLPRHPLILVHHGPPCIQSSRGADRRPAAAAGGRRRVRRVWRVRPP